MIKITGITSRKDKALVKSYADYVIAKVFPVNAWDQMRIKVNVINPSVFKDPKLVKEFKECGAWCEYTGITRKKKNFVIDINKGCINHAAKTDIKKYKYLLKWFGHELVHVKQYVTNQLFDYVDGRSKFEGRVFGANDSTEMDESYWFSPWELEAYSYQEGLYHCFVKKLNAERKV